MEKEEKKVLNCTQEGAIQSSDDEARIAVETSEQERYRMTNDFTEDDDFAGSCDYNDEPGWGSYEEYGGYNGYDDFTINSAFDGDPEATWNID